MYHFSAWKYWLVIIVMVVGIVFFLPNVFGEDDSLQIVRQNRQAVDTVAETRVLETLKTKNIAVKASQIEAERLILRFDNTDIQAAARDALVAEYPTEFSVALARASNAPGWMRKIGLKPMS